MALERVCAGARSLRFIAMVLIASALIGLCLPIVPTPERHDFMGLVPYPPLNQLHTREPGQYNRVAFGSKADTGNGSQASGSTGSSSTTHESPLPIALKNLTKVGPAAGEKKPASHESVGAVGAWRAIDMRRVQSAPGSADHDRRVASSSAMGGPGRSLRTSQKPACTVPPGVCKPWETCCGSSFVIPAIDPNHCGRCGHICKWDRACCNGKCRRLSTDEKNCGSCGTRCVAGTKCLYGLCGY